MSSYAIILNQVERRTRRFPALTGKEIRELFSIPATHGLVVCSASLGPDYYLHDEDVVSLRNGDVHVYTMQPTHGG